MEDVGIREMFDALGAVTIRRMFGGKGVYHQGLIIAIDLGDGMLLKADAISAPDFEAANARRWSYASPSGRRVQMPYWTVPDEALDDPDQMAKWARVALDAALRVAVSRSSVAAARPRFHPRH